MSGKDDNQFTFKGHLHTFEPFVQNIKWGLSGNQNAKSYAELRCISLENNKNYCQTNPCTNNSTCYNGITSYYCDCNCGWKGRTCNISKLIPGYEKHMWLVPPKKNDCIFFFSGEETKSDCELKCYTYILSGENEVSQPPYLVSCPEDFVCYREGKCLYFNSALYPIIFNAYPRTCTHFLNF